MLKLGSKSNMLFFLVELKLLEIIYVQTNSCTVKTRNNSDITYNNG